MRALVVAAAFILVGSAFAQTAAKPAPTPLFELTTRFIDDIGTDNQDVLIRVFKDGSAEYTKGGKPEVHRGQLSAGTVAHLGALLNARDTQRLKPEYPAWQGYGFSAVDYQIAFVSGSLTYRTKTANVFPIAKGKRDEYPTALLQLLCTAFDLRAAIDADFARSFYGDRGECEEFPRFAKATPSGK